jgi:hypothetical protein
MKFLRNKQFRQLGAYLSLLTLFVFLAEYFIIDYRIQRLEETELKIEFTQLAQLNNEKISLEVQHFLSGSNTLAASIAAHLNEQDHRLKVIANGGRMDERKQVIPKLSRLPKITFEAMKEDWEKYKHTIAQLLAEGTQKPASVPTPDTAQITTPVSLVSNYSNAASSIVKIEYEGLSLNLSNWYDKLIIDLEEEVLIEKSRLQVTKIAVLLINVILIAGIYFLFVQKVLNPLKQLEVNIAQHYQSQDIHNNEIGSVTRNINETIENLRDATEFVTAIGQGNLSLDYKEALDKNYTPGNNKLADSLIEMQQKLRQLNEEEQKRQWANEGLAKFVNILRSSDDNVRTLGDKIISALVGYTKSNQGGLYILNDEDRSNPYLELVSLFAFDIKKHDQQRIKPGEGILGQAFLEKDTTYLTYLPEEYVRITSGLGGATPKSILIVPLKVDKDVYGLVELASFNEYEPFEIDFVEKLGETIASTIASVRAAQKNRSLIEQFQVQTEQMRAQEEEMRQNMEELQATQEEVVRKERNYIQRIEELESALEAAKTTAVPAANGEADTLRARIASLEQELAKSSMEHSEWLKISELEQALRVNLDAAQLTHNTLKKRLNQ